MDLTEATLRELIATGESSTVEFKIKAPRPAELAERICGMVNSRTGGVIVLGVEDASGAIVGLERPNDTIDQLLRAARMVRPPVAFSSGGPLVITVDTATVVVAQIPPNDGPLYQASGVFWQRRGTHTTPMTVEEIHSHLHATGALAWERALCHQATLDDLDADLIDRYLNLRDERSRSNLRHMPPEEMLLRLHCAGRDADGRARPTTLGMLLFGFDPQLFVPHSEVVCIRYADSLGVGKYLDRKNISGTITDIIDKAADFVRANIREGAEIIRFTRIDLPEYPYEALREALVNAVAHRDYSREGETIRIFFYADRVEVHSPGLLPPGVTIDDLAAMRAPSRPRNPLLTQFLREIPGYMERIGSGARLMIQEMRQLGLADPEFTEQHEFVVSFRNGQVATSADAVPFNPRQVLALRIVHQKGSISSQEYSDATGATERTALRELRDMVDRGVLVVRGKARNTRYYRPS
jgi:predicted HTH transcriptional regulator